MNNAQYENIMEGIKGIRNLLENKRQKSLHDCYSSKVPNLSCYETISGELLLDFQGITEKVKCCPFCGHKVN